MTSLRDLTEQVQRLEGQLSAQTQRVGALRAEVTGLEAESTLLTVTTAALDNLLQLLTTESVGKVEQLVTYGLRTVFPDQDISFRFEVMTKFRAPWLEPRLIHNGIEGSILDSFGGGAGSLAAFILRLVVISRMGLAPLVLLDEPFSMVSSAYVDRVGVLLRDLCKSLGLTVVMVTHQPGFLEHADCAYQAEEVHVGNASACTFKRIVARGPDSGSGNAPADAP